MQNPPDVEEHLHKRNNPKGSWQFIVVILVIVIGLLGIIIKTILTHN